jgi:hypothetical protein
MLTIGAALILAAALVGAELSVALLVGAAAAANVFVYPIGRFWQGASLLLFVTAVAACAVLVFRSITDSRYPQPP